MPLYEYECDSCGKRFERIQKFSDPPADTCPACGGPVHKLLSSPAIQFKGSGWYVTDYARKGSQAGKGGAETGNGGDAGAKPKDVKEGAKPSGGGATEKKGTPAAPSSGSSTGTKTP